MANNPRFSNTLQALADAQTNDPITLAKPRRESWFDRQAKVSQLQNSKLQVVGALVPAIMEQIPNFQRSNMYGTLAERNDWASKDIASQVGIRTAKFESGQNAEQAENDARESVALLRNAITKQTIANGGATSQAAITTLGQLIELEKLAQHHKQGYGKIQGQRDVAKTDAELAEATAATDKFPMKDAEGKWIRDDDTGEIRYENKFTWNNISNARLAGLKEGLGEQQYIRFMKDNQILGEQVLLSQERIKHINKATDKYLAELERDTLIAPLKVKQFREQVELQTDQINLRARGLAMMDSAYIVPMGRNGQPNHSAMTVDLDVFERGMKLFDMGGQYSTNQYALENSYSGLGVKAIKEGRAILDNENLTYEQKQTALAEHSRQYGVLASMTHQEGHKLLNMVTMMGRLINNPEHLGSQADFLTNMTLEERFTALNMIMGFVTGRVNFNENQNQPTGDMSGSYDYAFGKYIATPDSDSMENSEEFVRYQQALIKNPTNWKKWVDLTDEQKIAQFETEHSGMKAKVVAKKRTPEDIAHGILSHALSYYSGNNKEHQQQVATQLHNLLTSNKDVKKWFQLNANDAIDDTLERMVDKYQTEQANFDELDEHAKWSDTGAPRYGMNGKPGRAVLSIGKSGNVISTRDIIAQENELSKLRLKWSDSKGENGQAQSFEANERGELIPKRAGADDDAAMELWLRYVNTQTNGRLGAIVSADDEVKRHDKTGKVIAKKLYQELSTKDHVFMTTIENDIISDDQELPGEYLNFWNTRNQTLHKTITDTFKGRIAYIGKTLGYDISKADDQKRMQFLVHQIYLRNLGQLQQAQRVAGIKPSGEEFYWRSLSSVSGIDNRGVVPLREEFYNRGKVTAAGGGRSGYDVNEAKLIKALLLSRIPLTTLTERDVTAAYDRRPFNKNWLIGQAGNNPKKSGTYQGSPNVKISVDKFFNQNQ